MIIIHEPRELILENVFDSLNKLGVEYFFGKVNNSCIKMMREFKNLRGNHSLIEFDVKDPSQLLQGALTSITATINKTIGKTVHTVAQLEDDELSDCESVMSVMSMREDRDGK